MKNFKLLLATVLLCVSQFVFAIATPAQQAAYDAALVTVALDVNNIASIDAAIQAAANADIPADVVVDRLFRLGVLPQAIRDAMSRNIQAGVLGSGVQPSCSPNCGSDHLVDVSYTLTALNTVDATLALLGAGAAPGAGGGPADGGLTNLAAGGLPATGGSPNGAVSPN